MNKHEQLEKLEKLEKELEKLKYLHKSLWESYGSELSSGDMENKEKELEYKIRKIKNEIVKDYFIERGAYPDFEITNSPMFEIKYKKKSKTSFQGRFTFLYYLVPPPLPPPKEPPPPPKLLLPPPPLLLADELAAFDTFLVRECAR